MAQNAHWLSLVDYSNKYKISISTLRRRIKLENIRFRLETGKYYIMDEPPTEIQMKEEPMFEPTPKMPVREESFETVTKTSAPSEDYNILSAANRLLDELKRAYTVILQEKDEQVRQLKEEISDLRTLVRVLENENTRLMSQKSSLDFE
ncbi:MAG: hypothetical protein AB7F59_00945 [Bdellovibrionales bacterium]